MMNLFAEHDLLGLQQRIACQEIKAVELVEQALTNIEQTESQVEALLLVQGEQALEQAREMDAKGPDGNRPLWGVPVVVKDVLATKGVPTTCASKMLQDFVPVYDAEVVARLKKAGAIILAKANMDEFAMGSSTENSAYKQTKNPWNLACVPGGSSGGSAASTAALQTPFSLGTDTGGSIRQPAAFCGLVGVKPTYGRVSRYGLIAYGSSLDQAGPLTRNVQDAALVLGVIAGHDPKDSTSAPKEVPDYVQAVQQAPDNLQGVRLGVPKEYWGVGLSPEVAVGCRQVLDQAADLGAEIVEISLPHTEYAIAAYYIIVMAEASSNLARYDGVRYGYRCQDAEELREMFVRTRSIGFGEEVKRRIILGTYVLSAGYYDAYYKKAAQVRRMIRDDFLAAFSKCDLICAPTAPGTAFRLGEKSSDPLQMYLTDIFTISLNLTGLPGLSIPVGLGQDSGLPVGFQLFGPAFCEPRLLEVASVLERHFEPLPLPGLLASARD